MASVPKMKPAKAAGKQKAKPPSLQTSSGKYTSTWDEEHFDGQFAAMQDFGEELLKAITRCEEETKNAIRLAHSAQKLPALHTGLEEWESALCASASTYYTTFFKSALHHRDDLGGKKPADFADALTNMVVLPFLRINAPDGEEIDSNGRVREFIRYVCEDSTNLGSDPVPSAPFRLPYWVPMRSFGTRLYLNDSQYADGFILKAEAKLTAKLRASLSFAHRKAVIETAQTPAPRAANARTGMDTKARTRPPDRLLAARRAIIRSIPRTVKGEAYCKELSSPTIGGRDRLYTPIAWQHNEKCPKRYLDAYWHSDLIERKKWRDRISNERYKTFAEACQNTELANTRNGRVSHNIQKPA